MWTTTPWTLPGNVAVAVAPEASYAKVRVGDEMFVLAEERVVPVLGEASRSSSGSRARSCSSDTAPMRVRSSPRPTARRARCRSWPMASSRPRTAPASCISRRPSARTTTACAPPPASSAAMSRARCTTRSSPDGTYDDRVRDREGRAYAGRFVKDPVLTGELIEDLRRARAAAARAALRALLPALLALRDAAALLRETVVVHRHDEASLRAAGGQRDRRMAPAARQARALRRLARQQRRLGALARALLGNAPAGVALRARPRPRDLLLRGARRSAPAQSCQTTIARSWTTSCSPARTRARMRRSLRL